MNVYYDIDSLSITDLDYENKIEFIRECLSSSNLNRDKKKQYEIAVRDFEKKICFILKKHEIKINDDSKQQAILNFLEAINRGIYSIKIIEEQIIKHAQTRNKFQSKKDIQEFYLSSYEENQRKEHQMKTISLQLDIESKTILAAILDGQNREEICYKLQISRRKYDEIVYQMKIQLQN